MTKKTVYKVSKMDCPTEEQMIRMKLEGIDAIKGLRFDIPSGKLVVFHEGGTAAFDKKLHELNLDARLEGTTEAGGDFVISETEKTQRNILWWVLAINFTFFVIEMTWGWLSRSMGLVADSLDMLADAFVYGLSLMAVGAGIARKKQVAKISGWFQMTLAFLGLIEVIRRFIGFEETPVFQTMIIVSALALVANSVSLWLIQRAKSKEAHMQASMIFTSNDIIINAGVIMAGVLVYLTQSKYPDLIIGTLIFLIVIRGAMRILKLAK